MPVETVVSMVMVGTGYCSWRDGVGSTDKF